MANAAGRKSALTKEVYECIVYNMKMGCSMVAAANNAGITRQSLYNWLKKGKENKGGEIYRQLYLDILKSKSDTELILVGNIIEAARENWNAAAWLLERINPKMYGKQRINSSADAESDMEEQTEETQLMDSISKIESMLAPYRDNKDDNDAE